MTGKSCARYMALNIGTCGSTRIECKVSEHGAIVFRSAISMTVRGTFIYCWENKELYGQQAEEIATNNPSLN